jgi:hypothetical protein
VLSLAHHSPCGLIAASWRLCVPTSLHLLCTPLLLLQGILAQAEDRIHRIGQRAPRVDIAYLVGHGTGAGGSGAGGSAGADASASFDDRLWRMVADKLETLHSALDAGPSAAAAAASGAAAAGAAGAGAAASVAAGGRGGWAGAGRAGGRGGRAGGERNDEEDGEAPEEEHAVAVTAIPDGLFDDPPPPSCPAVGRAGGGADAGTRNGSGTSAASSASAAAACAGSGAAASGAAPAAVQGTDAVRFFMGGAAGQGQTTMTSHFQRATGQLPIQRAASGPAAGSAGPAVGGGGVGVAVASAPRQPGAVSAPAPGLAFRGGAVASAAAGIAGDSAHSGVGDALPSPALVDSDAPFASSPDLLEMDAEFEAALAAAEAQALAAMAASRPAGGVAGTQLARAGPLLAPSRHPQQPGATAASTTSARSAAAHAVVAGPRPVLAGCAVPPRLGGHETTLTALGLAGAASSSRSAVGPAFSAAMPRLAHGFGSVAPAVHAPWPNGNQPRWPAAGGRGPIGAAAASAAGREGSMAPAARSLPGFQPSGSGLPGAGRPLVGSSDRL